MWQTIANGHVWHGTIKNRAKDGSSYWVESSIIPFLNEKGKPQRYIAIRTNITDQKTTQLKLSQATDIAETATQAKSSFLANMSHELRTPMHAIASFTSLAIKKIDDREKALKFLDNIRTSTVRLTDLLNDLLDLSKLEAGKVNAVMHELDLTTLIENAINDVSSLASDKQITLLFDTHQRFECMLDQKLITQVIINLLSNAIKFSPENSKVEISIENLSKPSGSRVLKFLQVSVIDEGVGIPVDEVESIFDKFVQSSKTRSNSGGTGLGLPISKEIIELHKGTIFAQSPPTGRSRGTSMIIQLPLSQEAVALQSSNNIENAINAHKEWIRVINQMIETKSFPLDMSDELISNENLCSLAGWINSGMIDSDQLEELKQLHKDFHFYAGESVAYCGIDNYLQGRQSSEKLKATANRIFEILKSAKEI